MNISSTKLLRSDKYLSHNYLFIEPRKILIVINNYYFQLFQKKNFDTMT